MPRRERGARAPGWCGAPTSFVPRMKRALSTSAFTRGTMYNWRVKAMMNALEKAGKATGPLQLADLTALGHLDQYHYLGTQACDHVIELLGIQADASVLDIGSGIGGPARYLSANTGVPGGRSRAAG